MSQPPKTIHYTQLPPSQPGHPRELEWETFRRELPRLIAEGHEGKWVLISKDRILGLYDTRFAGFDEGCRRVYYEGFLVQLVATYQPATRVRRWM